MFLANPDGQLLPDRSDIGVAIVAGDQQVCDLLSAQRSVRCDQHIQHALVRTADLRKRQVPIGDRLVVHRHDVAALPLIQPLPGTLALRLKIWGLPMAVRHAR